MVLVVSSASSIQCYTDALFQSTAAAPCNAHNIFPPNGCNKPLTLAPCPRADLVPAFLIGDESILIELAEVYTRSYGTARTPSEFE